MEAVGRLCGAKLPLHRRVASRGFTEARSESCEICRTIDGSIVKRRISSGRVSCEKAAPVEALRLSQARLADTLSCSSSVKGLSGARVQAQQEEYRHRDSATLDAGASQASESLVEAGRGRGKMWAFVTSLSLQGAVTLRAMASEAENSALLHSDTLETAASRAPEWLAPAIFAFPVVSYFLFGVYRDQVNPNAKVTDWLFGLVAFGIVANIVMQVTWGVRLY
ncbi:hypothetical protein MPTK1_1g18830 [Marchantia polymorpha subsp. ruderalis]|uniref:Uncharacterized protein n=3 Tax=Marchantia polymorpha TaxID=3197 RepID=A0AAF6ARP4_MARPO|nr:hypothetical protein MARPO_0001s0221 [Marchantia polymorpha]BBM99114.1 hypothetical protein Mp_1g18830 [Marchantia polymorpha subsp. ruderalis]|eukprot:PTQ50191.1 hypothetical protein MARPO_0001s0221 [Marchantia polymorpha]